MILDADELTKVLGKVFSETIRKELFENHFRLQGKSVRYFPKIEDALAALEKPEKEGGLNRDEHDWYDMPAMAHLDKVQGEKDAERVKAGNFERLGPTFEDLEKDPQALEKWQKKQDARKNANNEAFLANQKKGG